MPNRIPCRYSIAMKDAFKEWAIIVDALGRGDQILILRKGGIHEGLGGFQVEVPRFFLFPTRFHQQKDGVIEETAKNMDALPKDYFSETEVRIEYWAEVVEWRKLESWDEADRLKGQHVWTDEVIRERCDWSAKKGIYCLATRIHRLPEPLLLPILAEYGGCKSWIELAPEISLEGSQPALNESDFQKKLDAFCDAAPKKSAMV